MQWGWKNRGETSVSSYNPIETCNNYLNRGEDNSLKIRNNKAGWGIEDNIKTCVGLEDDLSPQNNSQVH